MTVADFPTSTEWLTATPGGIVQTFGMCERDEPHERHTFTSNVWDTHTSGWACPGQYAECRNCDDRKCMDCVLRIWHDVCEDSCPDCCGRDSE